MILKSGLCFGVRIEKEKKANCFNDASFFGIQVSALKIHRRLDNGESFGVLYRRYDRNDE